MQSGSSGCPFGSGNQTQAALKDLNTPKLPVGKERVKLLYEVYVHLPLLRAVWDSPITQDPVLEPCFTAAFHGIELCFLLLAEFVGDRREYVALRPRIERVAEDIGEQCKLLAEVIDGELEEEGTTTNRLSLTQAFPFPGAPPVSSCPGHSPGLARFEDAVRAALPFMSLPERNSVVKVVLNLTGVANAHFQRWSVGLGLEPQLNSLREAVGLPPLRFAHTAWLDYNALVRPEVVERTLTGEAYSYHEDFFFRTVHLGTECWARVALARLKSAEEHAAVGEWHVAAARMGQAARIFYYLGAHVMLLTTMNLRDYLFLKVELEGTSGEGSTQVKAFRTAVKQLLHPLVAALLGPGGLPRLGEKDGEWMQRCEVPLGHALMNVYVNPDVHREHYNYAKALEDLESGLLGGFYYKHFCLASNVLGSDARGTMRRAVQALKSTYETPVFPILDRVRSGLGVQVDAELSHIKGRMMQDIIDQYLKTPSPSKDVSNEAAPVIRGAGCPFGGGGSSLSPSHSFDRISPPKSTTNSLFGVYSWEGLSVEACKSASSEVKRLAASLGLVNHARGACGAGGPLAFLDHAWGQVSPRALHAALKDLNAMCLLGNPAWDHLFGHLMPRVAGHIRRLLGIEGAISANEEPGEAVSVHFGHNSHELVTRLLSQALFEREDTTVPLSILTSDTEFYSITRQLNRLVEAGAVNVHAVPADRPRTFAERCIAEATSAAAAGRPYDIVYVSQVSFLRQATLLDNVPAFVEALLEAVGGVGNTQSSTKRSNISGADRPLIIIDGYHAFGAFPVELGAAAQHCCYVAGLLKHTGCGPNCAFVTVPRAMELRPVFTGWLADPSVLGPGSAGIAMGSPVHYDKDLALQGGTPAFFLPLLVFDHVMRMWQEAKPAVDVETIHAHVLVLQEALIQGLPDRGIVGLTQETLVPVANAPCRSHTLVFAQPGAAEAKAVVEGLGRCGVLVDCRREMVRVGLGPNHSMADVQELLECLKGLTLG